MIDLDEAFESLRRNHGQGKTGKTQKADRASPVRKAGGARVQERHDGPVAEPVATPPVRREEDGARVRPAQAGAGADRAPVDPAPQAERAEVGAKGLRPPPFVRNERTPADWPKKHAPGSLKVGDSVWYRNERYWICAAPPTWEPTSFVQIADAIIRHGNIPNGVHTVSVHADLLELAPVVKSASLPQPTKHAIEVAEMKKAAGVTDVGDDVGTMLRGKSVDETYRIAAKFLGVPEAELRAKYTKLNPGQQRMVLGNRMRARMKSR